MIVYKEDITTSNCLENKKVVVTSPSRYSEIFSFNACECVSKYFILYTLFKDFGFMIYMQEDEKVFR